MQETPEECGYPLEEETANSISVSLPENPIPNVYFPCSFNISSLSFSLACFSLVSCDTFSIILNSVFGNSVPGLFFQGVLFCFPDCLRMTMCQNSCPRMWIYYITSHSPELCFTASCQDAFFFCSSLKKML